VDGKKEKCNMKIIITEKQLKKIKSGEFEDFASKRFGGAEKIANNAKEKGGFSMLTYHHFIVKLPYYKKASDGKFDLEKSKTELKEHLDKLCGLSEDVNIGQVEFQRLVGIIEVLGELIIKYKK
jgi:hypothetical protein